MLPSVRELSKEITRCAELNSDGVDLLAVSRGSPVSGATPVNKRALDVSYTIDYQPKTAGIQIFLPPEPRNEGYYISVLYQALSTSNPETLTSGMTLDGLGGIFNQPVVSYLANKAGLNLLDMLTLLDSDVQVTVVSYHVTAHTCAIEVRLEKL